MRKNHDNRPSTSQRTENYQPSGDFGNFGLEPPKHYHNDNRVDERTMNDFSSASRQRRSKAKNAEDHLTPEQRRRLQNQRRRQSKRNRKIILYSVLSVAIAAIFVVLSLTVLFHINTITVKGNEVYTKKEILAVLPIQSGENLLLTDTSAAAKKVKENLPYIYDISIKKKLPSTVVVTVKETPRLYYLKNMDKTTFTYIDDTFKVLENRGNTAPEGAIEIKNAEIVSNAVGKNVELKNKKVEENLKTLAHTVDSMQLDKITAIYSKDINNNYMIYDSRITLKLGNLDNVDEKMYSALSAIEKLNETNPQVKGTITATGDKQIYFTSEKK